MNARFALSALSSSLSPLLRLRLPLLAACLFATAAPAFAQAVWSDNFDKYRVDASGRGILSLGKNQKDVAWWSHSANDKGRETLVLRDTDNIFGRGSANQYLCFAKVEGAVSANNLVGNLFTPVVSGVLSFEFFVAEGDIGGALGFRLSLVGEGVSYAANLADYTSRATLGGLFIAGDSLHAWINNGKMDTAPTGTVAFKPGVRHRVAYVFNNSAKSVAYKVGGASHVLAAGDADLWLDGEKRGTWSLAPGAEVGPGSGAIGLWAEANTQTGGVLLLDNLSVSSEIAVP